MSTLLSRSRRLNELPFVGTGSIVYWMDRDMRLEDNWAYTFAKNLADQYDCPLLVVYNLDPSFLGGTLRQLTFKVETLRELDTLARAKGIPFFLISTHQSEKDLVDFFTHHGVSLVVTDFSPLRIQRSWKEYVARHFHAPLIEVDAHNCIPAWVVSPKYEIAARTIRPKIHRLLEEYLVDFPPLSSPETPFTWEVPHIDFESVLTTTSTDRSVLPSLEFPGGKGAASAALERFLSSRLSRYDAWRNDPLLGAQSDLSPYLHYGVIAPQRVALEVLKSSTLSSAKDIFIEELIVRRELSDNFCLHHRDTYDSLESAPMWAQQSLDAHRNDMRDFLYTLEEFESARTHDPLWNAAQKEMLARWKMHGYLRMYWAKKILEWTQSPEEALHIAIYLNDRYQLDGRDPNGYTGILWSIAGVHDRPWFDRKVYGVIRYMARSGCEKKFDVDAYIDRWK